MSNLDYPLSPLFFFFFFPWEFEYAYKDAWLRVGISQSNMASVKCIIALDTIPNLQNLHYANSLGGGKKKSFYNFLFLSVVFNYFFVSSTLKLCGEKIG